MTRKDLETQYIDRAYAAITSDYRGMANFVWSGLTKIAKELDDATLLELVALYTDENENKD